jgi:membrane-associated phospholipid phosphatase
VNRHLAALQIWLLSFLVSIAAVILSFSHLDIDVADWSFRNIRWLNALGEGVGSAVILSVETGVVLSLVFARLVRGRISRHSEATALACLTSMCAFTVNDAILKICFGVPSTQAVLTHGARHAFHFLVGSPDCSFPSGHMVLAGAFAGVLMKLYSSSIWVFSTLLSFGAALLVFGGWHFVSDVIAGTFIGVSVGLLAGELWQLHSN